MREVTAYLFSRLAEHHHEILSNPVTILSFVQAMVKGLQDKPRVSNMCCLALNHFATALQPIGEEQPANELTPYYKDIL